MPARGIDLEIIEQTSIRGDVCVLVPTCVRINGVEVLLPEDARIEISPISADEVVTATITVMVRSLTLKSEV